MQVAPGTRPQSPVAGGSWEEFPTHTPANGHENQRSRQRQQKIIPQIVSIVGRVQDFWLSDQESETQALRTG